MRPKSGYINAGAVHHPDRARGHRELTHVRHRVLPGRGPARFRGTCACRPVATETAPAVPAARAAAGAEGERPRALRHAVPTAGRATMRVGWLALPKAATHTHPRQPNAQHRSRQARDRRRANVCRPRMRGGSPPREGRNSPCALVNTLRTAARNLARQHEGRLVQCTRIRVCTGVSVASQRACIVPVCTDRWSSRLARPSVDRLPVCGSRVELLRVPSLGQSMVRDRSGTGAGVPMTHVCMYVWGQTDW